MLLDANLVPNASTSPDSTGHAQEQNHTNQRLRSGLRCSRKQFYANRLEVILFRFGNRHPADETPGGTESCGPTTIDPTGNLALSGKNCLSTSWPNPDRQRSAQSAGKWPEMTLD